MNTNPKSEIPARAVSAPDKQTPKPSLEAMSGPRSSPIHEEPSRRRAVRLFPGGPVRWLAVSCALCLGLLAWPAAQPAYAALVGVTTLSTNLVRIGVSGPAITFELIGPLNLPDTIKLSVLTYHPGVNALFATAWDPGDRSHLLRIDLATGQATDVKDYGDPRGTYLEALEYWDPAGSLIGSFGDYDQTGWSSPSLATVAPDGSVAPARSTGVGTDNDCFAYDSRRGVFYSLDYRVNGATVLQRLDPANGSLADLFAVSDIYPGDMAYGADTDTLYLLTTPEGTNGYLRLATLQTLDAPASWSASRPMPEGLDGIAFVPDSALALRLLNPAVVGTNFTFWFYTRTNQQYTVEYNEDLNKTNWVFHHNVTGDGLLLPCLIPMTNVPQRFFRVRQP